MRWVVFLLFWSSLSCASDFLELKGVELRYQNHQGVQRDPLYYATPIKEQWDFSLNLDLATYLGMDSTFHAGTDAAQFHIGGLSYFLYVRLTDSLQVGWSHQSLHVFDDRLPTIDYPLSNAIEVRLKIYESRGKRESLWP